MRLTFSAVTAAAAGALGLLATSTAHAQVTFSAAGADAAAIQTTVDAFRTALGANNGVGGSFVSGRREINWDGTPNAQSSPNALAANFFNVNSPRGVVFSTPGSGFQVSDRVGGNGVAVRFGNIDPSYTTTFSTFSSEKLFTPIGSNITDISFFVPGTTELARVSAFGSVFSDVDLAGTTTLQFFDSNNVSLGTFSAATANNGLSFLGVQFASPVVARVRIVTGNDALAAGHLDGGGQDLVVMDDFIYAEPRSVNAPEPASIALALLGGAGLFGRMRRRAR